MQVIFARAARQDLIDIVAYIAADNPAASECVYDSIVEATRRFADFPAVGRSGWLPGTCELVVSDLPYVIVCEVDGPSDTITVLAVFHGARDLVRALAERRTKAKG